MSGAEVSDRDREDFQRWLTAEINRYAANQGLKDRPAGRRPDHGRLTTGAMAIGDERRKDVPLALAALVLHGGGEDDPQSFLTRWVGAHGDIAEDVLLLLENDRAKAERHWVLGLRCQNDACQRSNGTRRFIRPVAFRRNLAANPDTSFATTAVCAKCGRVTALWFDENGAWMRSAPELQKTSHPMHQHEIHAWVTKVRPRTNRRASMIAPYVALLRQR